ncbi:holin [Serratia sp. S1B]|nr:holin [Serratia sp. S1B]
MPNGESTLVKLIAIGAVIGLGKVMLDDQQLTWRVVIGRMLLGSAVSMVAGVALIHFPELEELSLIGVASALGILGHAVIESLLKRYLQTKTKEADKS